MAPPLPALPMKELAAALQSAFFSLFVLTRHGWRPLREPHPAQRPNVLGRDSWAALADEVMALHEEYTGREGEFARAWNPLHHRIGGYQFYYLPRNLYRVVHVLEGLPWRAVNPAVRTSEWLEPGKTFRVLDLGCGSGAFSLGMLAWLARSGAPALPEIELVLVDQARAPLRMAQANVEALVTRALPGLHLRVRAHAEGLSRFLDRRVETVEAFSLVGAAMTLNELALVGADRRTRAPRLVERIIRQAAPGGVILLVEPGTRQGYLNLMALREQARGLPILYPCPHGGPCPMFEEGGRRWCHATVPLGRGFFFDEPLRRQGKLPLGMRELNLSALVLQASVSGVPEPPFCARRGSRVVSALLPGREPFGANEPVALLCTPEGRLREQAARDLGRPWRGGWVPAPGRR